MNTRQGQFDLHRVQAMMNRGDFAGALPALRSAARATPPDPQVLCLLGVCQMRIGNIRDAVSTLRKSINRRPLAEAYAQLSLAQRLASAPDDAKKTLEAGLAKFPEHPMLVASSVEMLNATGEHALALEQIERHSGVKTTPIELRMHKSAALLGLDRPDEALSSVQSILDDPSVAPLQRVAAQYRKGDVLDKMGEHDRAFDSYREANEANPVSFDAEAHEAKVDRLIEAWSRETLDSLRTRRGGEAAVFVLGMPRSGTTLVEQIIGRHSAAHAAGELTILARIVRGIQDRVYEPSDMLISAAEINARTAERAGREYLRELRKLDKDATRITDKLPSNFRHVGLIASAMPEAAIIHTVRHPIDTALSCYFQNFGSTNTWACDPETIGVYYRCYRRLMDHWRSLGIDVLEIEYESLVKNQETHSKRAIEHVGLAWEDACLRFHESDRVAMTASMAQVRKPMYTSSLSRHEKYAAHIAPFADAMGLE
jgi:tetratricopeptide (TPR) repeat protein